MGIGGAILASVILNFLVTEVALHPAVFGLVVLIAAVLARYQVGLFAIWIALFPPLFVVLGNSEGFGVQSSGAVFLASVVYGTFGFPFGRAFAWMRRNSSRGETFSSFGRGLFFGGLVGYVIAILMAKSGLAEGPGLTDLGFWQGILLLWSQAALPLGICSYVVGGSLSWNRSEEEGPP